MVNYKCYNITLEDGSVMNNSIMVSVPSCDTNDPLDRQDHLVAISGALESVVGCDIESFSYIQYHGVILQNQIHN